jgi:DNA mismatch repair protein MutH
MKSDEALPKLIEWVGKQVRDVLDESGTTINISSKNKGIGGQFLELGLGIPTNSRPEPDFDDGVELKKVSVRLDIKNSKLRVKEPVKVTKLNDSDIVGQAFDKSHAFAKSRHVIFVPTLYIGRYRQLDEVVLPHIEWKSNDEIDKCFASDFENISTAIENGRKLTSRLGVIGKYLIPKTNGQVGETENRGIYLSVPALTEIIGEEYLSLQFEFAKRNFEKVV